MNKMKRKPHHSEDKVIVKIELNLKCPHVIDSTKALIVMKSLFFHCDSLLSALWKFILVVLYCLFCLQLCKQFKWITRLYWGSSAAVSGTVIPVVGILGRRVVYTPFIISWHHWKIGLMSIHGPKFFWCSQKLKLNLCDFVITKLSKRILKSWLSLDHTSVCLGERFSWALESDSKYFLCQSTIKK